MNPLLVNAAELLRRPGSDRELALTVPLVELGVVDPSRFDDDAEVTVSLRLDSLSDGIVVHGVLHTPWRGVCRRCLVETSGVADSGVHELYQKVVTAADAFQMVGDQLDLRSVVRELVLLDAPLTPLCRPDCAGLCPTCGVDRNTTTCECEPPPVDPRWAALDVLKESADKPD
ncbi:YceD family protein [soil metagenome]